MKKVAIFGCVLLAAAAIQAQTVNVSDENQGQPAGINRPFFGAPIKSGDFFQLNFCMSSINTGTYVVFTENLVVVKQRRSK